MKKIFLILLAMFVFGFSPAPVGAVVIDDGARAVVREEESAPAADSAEDEDENGEEINNAGDEVAKNQSDELAALGKNHLSAGKASRMSRFFQNPAMWFLLAFGLMIPLIWKSREEASE